MEEAILIFLSGTAGAALIKMIDGIIQFHMTRKATKEDQEEKRAENKEKTQDEEIKELKDEITLVNKIDYKVMKEYIKQIVIQPDGRIITVFINNAKITNGGAENAS